MACAIKVGTHGGRAVAGDVRDLFSGLAFEVVEVHGGALGIRKLSEHLVELDVGFGSGMLVGQVDVLQRLHGMGSLGAPYLVAAIARRAQQPCFLVFKTVERGPRLAQRKERILERVGRIMLVLARMRNEHDACNGRECSR